MLGKGLDPLFRAWRHEIERFLRRRVRSVEVAEDLAQEAFLRLVRVGVDELDDAKAYLFRTASNLLTDHYRAQARQPGMSVEEAALEVLEDHAESPVDALESRELHDVLRAAVNDLPPRGREIFILHKFNGISYSQIAERLGISPNTVTVHMARSLAHCHRRLQAYREGDTSFPPRSR